MNEERLENHQMRSTDCRSYRIYDGWNAFQ